MAGAMRVVVAVLGHQAESDPSDRIVGVLRDAGVEVIHAGVGAAVASVVAAVVQEDADALVLAIDNDEQLTSVVELLRLLRQECDDRVRVVVRGGLSPAWCANLHELGVSLVLEPANLLQAMLDTL